MEGRMGIHRKSESNLRRPGGDSMNGTAEVRAEAASASSMDLPKTAFTHIDTSSSSCQPRRSFSLLRLRNVSDPSLGHKARKYDPKLVPPVPSPPAIIRTPPTFDMRPGTSGKGFFRGKISDNSAANPTHSAGPLTVTESSAPSSSRSSFSRLREGASRTNSAMRMSKVTFDEPDRSMANPSEPTTLCVPPPYDEHTNTLSIPTPRLSESSRSTASSGEQIAVTTTTTHTVSTTTTFWKIPRRKRTPQPLFPLPPKVDKTSRLSNDHNSSELTSRPATGPNSTPSTPSRTATLDKTANASSVLAASSLGLASHGTPLMRSNSTASVRSMQSNPASLAHRTGISRGRSLTLGAVDSHGIANGRNSISGLFGLRMRRESEPGSPSAISRGSSPQPYHNGTTTNSQAVSREKLIIPERNDEDTPQMYLSKMETAVSKSVVASLLARSGDSFHVAVLKSYMATFEFKDDPMDMALRKLLMEAELPRETQQIDRVLQAFAERYHECNPLIYTSPEQAYFIAFSLLILHTDVFNKNNRHKMQKAGYVKNTQGEGITTDILECFYANITYTPFIHVEDDFDINGERIVPAKPKRGLFGRTSTDSKRNISIKEPVDPYALIMEHRLDILRPSLKDVIEIEDPYHYLGTAPRLDIAALHKSFFRYAVLQIVSPRSRPDAFLLPSTQANPQDADPGVVDIKITKIGILWRKETKKKKMRDPWQEWGAMLTGSQLYFFKNVGWIKSLMQQYEHHQRSGNWGTPVVFTPPLHTFKPDALVSTDDAVALLDRSYKKHKFAFAFIRHGGVQEYFLAESESEMNDWLAKLNYAATFRTAGVRMRGVVGGNYEGQRVRVIRRLGDSSAAKIVDSPSGEVSILRGGIDHQLAADIANARRQIVKQKIQDAEERLSQANKQLDAYLRNARHLSILTPIQAKTREQVVMAAGALAAKLQWVRMGIWKLRCHLDILILDMEEEAKDSLDYARRSSLYSPIRRPSKASAVSTPEDEGGIEGHDDGSPTPTQAHFDLHNGGLVPFLELPEQSPTDTWELRRGSFDRGPRNSISSATQRPVSASSLMPPVTEAVTEGTDTQSIETSKSNQSVTRSEEDLSLDMDMENGKAKRQKEPSSRPSIRKGIQKTLRDAHVPGHRPRRSKDMTTEGGPISEKAKEEGLARDSKSFTLHGKKASVITFGSEWHTMSPEERIRRQKSLQTPDPNSEYKSPILNDGSSTMSRQNSQVNNNSPSQSTETFTIRNSSGRRGSNEMLQPARVSMELNNGGA